MPMPPSGWTYLRVTAVHDPSPALSLPSVSRTTSSFFSLLYLGELFHWMFTTCRLTRLVRDVYYGYYYYN